MKCYSVRYIEKRKVWIVKRQKNDEPEGIYYCMKSGRFEFNLTSLAKHYAITLTDDRLICSCLYFSHMGLPCAHILRLNNGLISALDCHPAWNKAWHCGTLHGKYKRSPGDGEIGPYYRFNDLSQTFPSVENLDLTPSSRRSEETNTNIILDAETISLDDTGIISSNNNSDDNNENDTSGKEELQDTDSVDTERSEESSRENQRMLDYFDIKKAADSWVREVSEMTNQNSMEIRAAISDLHDALQKTKNRLLECLRSTELQGDDDVAHPMVESNITPSRIRKKRTEYSFRSGNLHRKKLTHRNYSSIPPLMPTTMPSLVLRPEFVDLTKEN